MQNIGSYSVKTTSLSKAHLRFLRFIVLTLFVFITADFSPYFIPYGREFFPIFSVFLLISFYRDLIDSDKNLIVCMYFLICFFVYFFHFFLSFQIPNIRLLVEVLFACSFFCIKSNAKLYIYDKFVKTLAFLLFFAIIEYFLLVMGVSTYIGEANRVAGGQLFRQGILNLVNYYWSGFFRFHFITEEPGYIGTLCFFLIATLNRKQYKKEYVVFIIAGLISFSLAFYLLFSLWILSKIKPSNFKFILVPLSLYVLFYEPINELIVNRITNKDGIEAIDNRNSNEMNKMFNEMWSNGQIIVGIGNRELYALKDEYFMGSTTGIKSFLMQYGIIGFALVFISFSYVFFQYNKINYSNTVILILFWLSFYQRADLNLETNVVVLFSYSLVGNNNDITIFVANRKNSFLLEKSEGQTLC